MRRFLKTLFGRGDVPDIPDVDAHSSPSAENPEASAVNPSREFGPTGSVDDVLADLVAQVCETMPDPRPKEEIDTALHMYDAGYVTSITAADLLAHIEERYGVDISETKLIGPLQNLAALAAYVHTEAN